MRTTPTVFVGNVPIGSNHPIVVQSMTNTRTDDIDATVTQIKELADAGSEIVRITVNDAAAAKAVPHIIERLRSSGYSTPIVGDFHYNGHHLLSTYPECARALDKYRINPGNSGQEKNFQAFIHLALQHDKPVRIGVNAGSLDQSILNNLMENNARQSAESVHREAVVQSALQSALVAKRFGLADNNIILSVKMSDVQDVIAVTAMLASRCTYPLHIGLTEAGMGRKGTVASAAALGILLQQGIGNTIRVSLTPAPGQSRTEEVHVAKSILQSLKFRAYAPTITACPGCGRTSSEKFQHLAQAMDAFIQKKTPEWTAMGLQGFEKMTIAVMGCVVNGPGESKHANIGISFPGNNEHPSLVVYEDGKKSCVLVDNVEKSFMALVERYVLRTYKAL